MISLKLALIAAPQAIEKASKYFSPTGEAKVTFTVGGKAVNLELLPYSPESSGMFPSCDGLLVYCSAPEELAAVDPIVMACLSMPIKFLLYDSVPAQAAFETKWSIKPLAKPAPPVIAEELLKADLDLQEMIRQVFVKFDKDKSGFIDLKEIQLMAKEMNNPIPEAEAQLVLKELDTDKDGKISMAEFTSWWKSGRKGTNLRLSSMVVRSIKKSRTLTVAADLLDKYGGMKELKEEDKREVHLAGAININKVKVPGFLMNLHTCTKSKLLDELQAQFGASVGAPMDAPYVCLSFGCSDPKAFSATIKETVETVMMFAGMADPQAALIAGMIDFGFGFDDKRAILRVSPKKEALPLIEPFLAKARKLPTMAVPDQQSDVFVRFQTSLGRLATEDKPIIEQLLEGISIEFNMAVTEKMLNILAEMNREAGKALNLCASFVKYGKASFDIEVGPAEIANIHEKLGFLPTRVPLKGLKGAVSPKVQSGIDSAPFIKNLYELLKTQLTSLEVYWCLPNVFGLKFFAELAGLEQLLSFE